MFRRLANLIKGFFGLFIFLEFGELSVHRLEVLLHFLEVLCELFYTLGAARDRLVVVVLAGLVPALLFTLAVI